MKNVIPTFLTLLALSGPSWAAGFLYECDIPDHKNAFGWVSPKIAIIMPGDDTVQIVDALTIQFVKKPVVGTILRDNSKRLIVKWSIEGARADNGTSFSGFNYRASISKSNGAVEVKAIPDGYDKGVRGTGVCKKRSE